MMIASAPTVLLGNESIKRIRSPSFASPLHYSLSLGYRWWRGLPVGPKRPAGACTINALEVQGRCLPRTRVSISTFAHALSGLLRPTFADLGFDPPADAGIDIPPIFKCAAQHGLTDAP